MSFITVAPAGSTLDVSATTFTQDDIDSALQLIRHCKHEQQHLRASAERQDRLLAQLSNLFTSQAEQNLSLREGAGWKQASAEFSVRDEDELHVAAHQQELKGGEPLTKPGLSKQKTALNNLQAVLSKPQKTKSESQPTLSMSGLKKEKSRDQMSLTPAEILRQKAEEKPISYSQRAMMFGADALDTYEAIKEPEREGLLANIVTSGKFSTLCTTMICANGIFIAATADYEIQYLGEPPTEVMSVFEGIFTYFYVVELVMKLLVHRLYFFVNVEAKWNIFDFSLVAFSMIEKIAESLASGEGGTMNVGFLRLLRLFKMAKILRVFRVLRFFTELRLMVDCCIGSFLSVFWSVAMIFFVLYVFGLLILQLLTNNLLTLLEDGNLDDHLTAVRALYGSVLKSMVTLFMSTTSGIDWKDAYEVLEISGWVVQLIFIFFIALFTISVWNIVTSTFVEKAMKLAQPDLDTMVFEKHVQDQKDTAELETMFQPFATVNEHGCSDVDLTALQSAAEAKKFRASLAVRGIDIKNIELFYGMLNSLNQGQGVDVLTLVAACVRMRGVATSIDVQSLSFETKVMNAELLAMFQDQQARLENIQARLNPQVRVANVHTEPPESTSPASRPGTLKFGLGAGNQNY